ncbi:MAG: hypothetical protein CMJ48_04965 [Planctomycetaceae bacterium]|nr:hypothetical protein [Planctomycetaceae bacterium]
MLNVTELPHREAAGQLVGTALAPEFVLQPGDSCTLALQLNHSAIDAKSRAAIEKRFRDQLASHRIKVANGQKVQLVVTISEKTGESISREYSSFGIGSGRNEISMTKKIGICRVAFRVNGETAWTQQTTHSNDIWFVHRSKDESIEQAINRMYQGGLRNGFNSIQLPPYVFTPKSANGVGTTQLVSGP